MPKLTHSYVSGTSAQPLIGETIGRYFDAVATACPEREALVVPHQNLRCSYAELRQRVDDFAAGLLALGLLPGDRVGVWSPNCWEWIVTQFATAKLGLILVTVNPGYRSGELEFVLNKVGCKALVTAARFKSSDYIAMLHELAPELASAEPGRLDAKRLPHLRSVIRIDDAGAGMFGFDEVARLGGDEERARAAAIGASLQFDDPINIQFTSGTTGSPKGATLTHHNLLNNGYLVAQRLNTLAEDRFCVPVPLYHCFAMVLGTLGALSHAATLVLPGEAFDPEAVLRTVHDERCTILYGVPTMFIAELNHPSFAKFDLTSLRTGVMAGSPCPVEIMRRVIDEMHMREVTIAYGMTETSPVSFQGYPDDPLEKRVGTIGRIMPHTEAKIVDADNRVVPVGTPGEFCARGYCVMRGYWDEPEKTREAIDAGGWMHTGDLAVFDADGYCNIVGRIKDMVIRGGENIYPREVEEHLYQHPKIADVQIFGVPDEKYGEELCAWVKLAQGSQASAEEIRDWCKQRIAHYKVPRYVEFVDEFPMTVSGKAQKFIMRDAMIERLKLVEVKTA